MNYIVLGVLIVAVLAFTYLASKSRPRGLDWVRRLQDVDPRARHWMMAGIRERNWLSDKLGSPAAHPLLREIDQILCAMLPVSLAWLESDLALKRLRGTPAVDPVHLAALEQAEVQQRNALERAVERIRNQVHTQMAMSASTQVDSVNFQDLRETVDELQAAQEAREELRQVLGSP